MSVITFYTAIAKYLKSFSSLGVQATDLGNFWFSEF